MDVGYKYDQGEHFKFILEQMEKTQPSDYVVFDRESDLKIMNFWSGNELFNVKVPSDLFFQKTIPIEDIWIEIDERNETYEFDRGTIQADIFGLSINGFKCRARIKIFDTYKKVIDYLQSLDEPDGFAFSVGAIEVNFNIPKQFSFLDPGNLIIPLCVSYGEDYIGSHNIWSQKYKCVIKNDSLIQSALGWLVTWYGVQISLLHPELKTIFSNPKKETIYSKSQNSSKKIRVTRYVKKHYIRTSDIDKALQSNDKNINRKTLAWYVIGHWRNYKNGKKKFIQGYWKGPLRQAKRNFDEGRERIIDVKEAI